MGFNRGNFLSALAGLIVGVLLISVLPAAAGDGDPVYLGQKNTGKTVTRINTRGGVRIDNFKPGNPALILNVADLSSAPMTVNATGLVENLNADLFDGLDSLGFDCPGCLNLSEVDFSGHHMPGSDFSDAVIGNNFTYANLTGSDFSGATLIGSKFRRANLQGVDFSSTICNGGQVTFAIADLTGANLDGMDCPSDANFAQATLVGATLNSADFTDVYFGVTNSQFAQFIGSDLTRVNFIMADLTGAVFTGSTRTDINWNDTTCPDGTNSDDHGNTCEGHL